MARGTVLDALRGARELIESGWCQGDDTRLVHGQRQYCIVGALGRATRKPDGLRAQPEFTLAHDALQKAIDGKYLGLAWFNDEPIPIWIMIRTLVGSMLARRTPRKK